MSTIDKAFADRIIAGNGWLPEHTDHDAPDNPRCLRIVKYTNAWGNDAYGATFAGQSQWKYMLPSSFVRNPVVYWEAPPIEQPEEE